jgi:hypothetical protein
MFTQQFCVSALPIYENKFVEENPSSCLCIPLTLHSLNVCMCVCVCLLSGLNGNVRPLVGLSCFSINTQVAVPNKLFRPIYNKIIMARARQSATTRTRSGHKRCGHGFTGVHRIRSWEYSTNWWLIELFAIDERTELCIISHGERRKESFKPPLPRIPLNTSNQNKFRTRAKQG